MHISTARENAAGNPAAPSDYATVPLELGNIDDYRIIQRIGNGRYSEVFVGICCAQASEKKSDASTCSDEKNEPTKTKGTAAQEEESLPAAPAKDQKSSRTKHSPRVVIKALRPNRAAKINREVFILRTLSHPNIITLKDVVFDRATDTHSIIFEYVRHRDTTELFDQPSIPAICAYARQIFEALAYAYAQGVIHRDIKPQNMIVAHNAGADARRRLLIIDWGLADFYRAGQKMPVRVASRHYKAPELLMEYPYYDYAVDVWAAGCILGEMLTRRRPFFANGRIEEITGVGAAGNAPTGAGPAQASDTSTAQAPAAKPPQAPPQEPLSAAVGTLSVTAPTAPAKPPQKRSRFSAFARFATGKTTDDGEAILENRSPTGTAPATSETCPKQLVEIANLLGTEDLHAYVTRLEIPCAIPEGAPARRAPLIELVPENRREAAALAVDLLEKILVYDHEKRLTARECLEHPFFQKDDAHTE